MLKLRVRWTQPPPGDWQGRATEFGMQEGRFVLLPGGLEGDATVFETAVTPYTDKEGRQRFRGPCVQGTADEPFLYLSWRIAGERAWAMRAKVMLTPLTAEFLAALPHATLETDVSRFGHRAAGSIQDWRVV